jgi:DNA-repair protein XRCC3
MLKTRPLVGAATARCSSGCPVLDRFLGGGFACRQVTELAGEAGAAKTQLCLQLLLAAQLPAERGGLAGAAVYVCTEGEPPMGRLRKLAAALPLRHPPAALAGLPDPAANIFLEAGADSAAALLARLERLRPLLASAAAAPGRRVRLLVVDSVAAALRDLGEHAGGAGALAARTELAFRLSALLRRYADEHDLAVVVVNQAVDAVEGGGGGARGGDGAGGPALASGGRRVAPALGLAWANCVNARLFLAREAAPGGAPVRFRGPPSEAAQRAAAAAPPRAGAPLPPPPQLRTMRVVFSPELPPGECHYVVEAVGVRGLHPAELAAA